MITNIQLNGFKSFENGDLKLAPFTLLTGLNSSGKSSAIQALLMVERAAKGKDFLLNEHGTGKELTNIYSSEFNIIASDQASKRIHLRYENDHPGIMNDGISLPHVFYSEAGRYGSQSSIKVFNSTAEMDSKGGNLLKCIDTYADEQINENLRHPDAQGETLMFNLKAWLDIISPGVNFTYELQRLSDQSFPYFDDHRATNVGFGLSYTLPIIALLLRASLIKDSLVLLENPEAHLHPKGQTEMGKFIALCADNGVNVVVETHSDHLFDGIRIYTKQHPAFAEKFISYWFELDKRKSTQIYSITLEKDGKYSNEVPRGFFDQFETDAEALLF
ncbi:MAG: AAA family ATPase [Muribaculaceae bacterium]|nr:AAA family ATPase [Muribaculaceae bacterium]